MNWKRVCLERFAGEPALAQDRLHVWWWPQLRQPRISDRRRRADALLRAVLACYMPVAAHELQFGHEPHGRPFLRHAAAPDFNLSDTTGGTVIAVAAGGRVGIDIERCDRSPPVRRLAQRWFAPNEAQSLSGLEPELARQAFLRLWTAKEAACKATGTGIFGFLSTWRFVVDARDLIPQPECLPEGAGEISRWRFHRLAPASSHTVAIACQDIDAEPRGFVVTR